MAIHHEGVKVPVMDLIMHTGNREWVLFAWDDFLHENHEIQDSQFFVSDGLVAEASREVTVFNYRGRTYTKCFAVLVDTVDSGSSLTPNDPHVAHYISHKLILVGGFEIERTVKIMSGII